MDSCASSSLIIAVYSVSSSSRYIFTSSHDLIYSSPLAFARTTKDIYCIMMNIVSDEGNPCHHGSNNMRTDTSDEVTAAVMMWKNPQRKSERTSIGRTKRHRSYSIDGRCSSSPSSTTTLIKSRKYPTNHKHIPFIRSPPTTRYHGNYWIRMKPVAVRSNISSTTMQVMEQYKNPTFFKEQQVPSLKDEEEQQFLHRSIDADNNLFPLLSSTTVRRVSKSASFDDELDLDLHLPLMSPFSCCQWRQSGSSSSTMNCIHPRNSIVFYGESGKPVIIRPKSAHVVR